ncbi:RHS repeat-associated core domain-containing protein [Planctomycetota bacterium]
MDSELTYDAYPNLINIPVEVDTPLRFSGKYTAPASVQQYLRARYYDPANGRFNRLDPFAGMTEQPQSLHKYGYVHGDPINHVDPTGNVIGGLGSLGLLSGIGNMIQARAKHSRAVFAQGGAAIGSFFQSLGLYTQNLAYATISSVPGLHIIQNQAVGRRFIDFIVRKGDRLMMIEVKYGIPQRLGPALDRLAGQMTAMVQSNAGQAVVWSLRAPSAAQLTRVQNAVGPEIYNRTQFADGVFGLIQVVKLYFGS